MYNRLNAVALNKGRALCIKENPMTTDRVESQGVLWEHSDVIEINKEVKGHIVVMCRNCNYQWRI
jgi:hypothetical protein